MKRLWVSLAFKSLRQSPALPLNVVVRRTLTTFAKRNLKLLRVQPTSVTRNSPKILPSDVPIEEELGPDYKPNDFYPIDPGDLFHNKYETLAKLGHGNCSTVWLARDIERWRWQSNRYVVLKVKNCGFADKEAAEHELNISQHLAKTNPSHEGFLFVRTTIDNFELASLHGTHTCLVFEPMREPLWLFLKRCENHKFPLPLLKGYMEFLLKGLDYLHSECRIIHTDLKLDNILVSFEDPSVIDNFVRAQAENPMPRKIRDGRSIYLSHNNVGPIMSYNILPKIADFGLARRGDSDQPQILPIQSDNYRAPEVILGTGWTYGADIWNLGVLIWNLMEGKNLFTRIHTDRGEYRSQLHLAEMIALLGPPPQELPRREAEMRHWKWSPAIENPAGKLCENARELFGGPFFDSEGEFLHKHLIPSDLTLADSVPSLQGEDKRLFLQFVQKMLRWIPEERMTAKELLNDPWLRRNPT